MTRPDSETWSTHQMYVTLSNIDQVYFDAREQAQADPTGNQLRHWVSTWFRGDLRHLTDTNRSAIKWLSDNMAEAEWGEIDWASVAEDLAAD